jgi:hypothetical protein
MAFPTSATRIDYAIGGSLHPYEDENGKQWTWNDEKLRWDAWLDVAPLDHTHTLADVTDAGTAAATAATDYATAAQGSTAETALQPTDIASGTITAKTGDLDFNDLGGAVDNAAINAAIAEDPSLSLHAIGAPRQSPAALKRVSFLSSDARVTSTLHTRGIGFGDSIYQSPRDYLWATVGFGGRIVAGNDASFYTLAGGSTSTGPYAYNKAFGGTHINLGASGTATFNGVASSTRPLYGRQIQVWYWSETGGGTFKVQKNSVAATGTYSDLIPDNAGTATGTTAASATIDAAEGGGTGALRLQTYTMTNYEYINVRCTGLSGSAKIVAVGVIEVPDQRGSRITGYSEISCAVGGSQPSHWDDITDAALTTLITSWDPSVVYFRGYETLSQWQTEWAAFVARIRAIKPSIEVVVIGMHNTGDAQGNALDSTDAFLQDWCDDNDGVFIPVRNRVGTFKNNIATGFYSNPQSTIKTITGVSATGVITVNPAINESTDGYAVGKYLRFTALTGGSGLSTYKSFEPYRILEIPTSTTLKLAAFDGTTPVSFGSNITAGTMDLFDLTHPSSDGVTVINALIAEACGAAATHDRLMRGNLRKTFSPETVQTSDDHSSISVAGPSHKWKTIEFKRNDGAQSATAYPPLAVVGAKQVAGQDAGIITSSDYAGFGMAWLTNHGVIGSNPQAFTRTLSSTALGRPGDTMEIYNGNAGLVTLAISKAGTSASDQPFIVGRIGATAASKGSSEAFVVDATGRANFNIPNYADDAAADADSALPSGFLYRTTAGGRAVSRKP